MVEQVTEQQLKDKLHLSDFKNITAEDYQRIQEMLQRNQLSMAELNALVGMIPHIVELLKTCASTMSIAIQASSNSQKQVLEGISGSLEGITAILSCIAEKVETDEQRIKIAEIALKLADYQLQVARILQDVNRENNNAYKHYIVMAASVFLTAVSMMFYKRR